MHRHSPLMRSPLSRSQTPGHATYVQVGSCNPVGLSVEDEITARARHTSRLNTAERRDYVPAERSRYNSVNDKAKPRWLKTSPLKACSKACALDLSHSSDTQTAYALNRRPASRNGWQAAR